MKIGVIGDPHIGCSIYSDRRATDFSEKFRDAVFALIDCRVDAVTVLGDVFDSSAYRRSVDAFASRLSEVAPAFVGLQDAGIPCYVIAGNHEYGRGRAGGELRVLRDLGIIRLLDGETVEVGDIRIAGVSWHGDRISFLENLRACGTPADDAILLIHQFCAGSRHIPSMIAEVTKEDLSGWRAVFAGHHHQYEDLGYAVAPGALEPLTVDEVGCKGYVVYDTESRSHEFIPIPQKRIIRSFECSAEGRSAADVQKIIETWVRTTGEKDAILVIKCRGTLSSGRPTDIDWRSIRTAGTERGCLTVHIGMDLDAPIRTAREIGVLIDLPLFLRRKFGQRSERAAWYIEGLEERDDVLPGEIVSQALERAGRNDQ